MLRHALLFLPLLATIARAQQEPPPRLGLAASGALGLHLGVARVEHSDPGVELAGSLDLGWVGTRRVRLVLSVEQMVARVQRPDSMGVGVSGPFYDFSAGASLAWIGAPGRRVAPFGSVGLAVHALGSNTGSTFVDAFYNDNVLGAHGSLGATIALSPDGRQALQLELRGVSAAEVNRAGIRVGYLRRFRDLARPTQARR